MRANQLVVSRNLFDIFLDALNEGKRQFIQKDGSFLVGKQQNTVLCLGGVITLFYINTAFFC